MWNKIIKEFLIFKAFLTPSKNNAEQKDSVEEGVYIPPPSIMEGDLLMEIDIYSPTWKFVCAWADGELARMHKANESKERTYEQTMYLRGEIKSLRKLLALPTRKGILTDARRKRAV